MPPWVTELRRAGSDQPGGRPASAGPGV